MNIMYAAPSEIARILTENLRDDKTLFIFPTDIAASSWADWIVSHPSESGVRAVPLERFTAWDKFKSSMMNAKVAGRRSIPSLLRKIFVRRLIAVNAEASLQSAENIPSGKTPLFKSLINPQFAENAFSFTDWIARILPSLETWHAKYEVWLSKQNGADSDAENQDYLMLYTLYKKYLDENKLFEPSWITPDFSMQGSTCILFYPETLEDFSDYRSMMERAEQVNLVMLPEQCVHPEVSFYTDSRTELRAASLKIRSLVSRHDASWSDIAVSVSDIDTWRPYIEREFSLYCIPFIIRAGEPYTSDSAGRVFREIQDCRENNFSYDSVRALLLDGYIPWKENVLNENLVREGSERKCICSYEEGSKTIDPWEQALSSEGGGTTERELRAYRELKKRVTALCRAETFMEIRMQWFAFRSEFLDSTKFSDAADLILGRCLMVLSELIDIESEFLIPANLSIPQPYGFFLNELENSIYQKQPGHAGVSVFPYRLSSCAQFRYQFILDASQKKLTVPYRSLSFLNRKKREALLGPDKDDASNAFVRLYAEKDTAYFSASQQTFSGFSIPYSFFTKRDKSECSVELASLTAGDFITQEIKGLSEHGLIPGELSELQKKGFREWKKHLFLTRNVYDEPCAALKAGIDYLLCRNRSKQDNRPDRIHIAQTDLKNFYPCRRAWIFSQVLRLSDDTLATSLMEKYDAGSINHKILELFMTSYQKSGFQLPVTNNDGKFDNESEIRESLCMFSEEAFHSPDMAFCGSPLVLTVLEAQKERFADTIQSFLHSFCLPEKGFGGYTVIAVEQWMNGCLEDDPDVSFTGRIDCILADHNGDASIIDYKNSKAPAAAECIAGDDEQLSDFQIPLYVTLWNCSQKNTTSNKLENVLFYTISGQKGTYVIQNEKKGRAKSVTIDEYDRTLQVFNKYVKDFVSDVRSFNFSVSSDRVEAYRDCSSCRFKSICRTSYISSGVRIPDACISGERR
jgi:RecB family exonuclease